MELKHGKAKSYFSTSQYDAFSFQWKIQNFSNLKRNDSIYSPEFYYKQNNDPWHLELGNIYSHPNNFLQLYLHQNSENEIDLKYTITVSQNQGISFHANSEWFSAFSKWKPVGLLSNIQLPRPLIYDSINITCTINAKIELDIGSNTESLKRTSGLSPDLIKSESQNKQLSVPNQIRNNSGDAGMKEVAINSDLTQKKIKDPVTKAAACISEQTHNSEPENPADDSPDLLTLKQLSIDFKKMLIQAENTDATIRVADTIIEAHKAILSSRSPVFSKMFEYSTLETVNNEIKVTDIRASVMKKLVNYLYSGEKGRLQYDDACDLYYAADKYEVLHLRELCKKDLLCLLDVDNACPMLSLANRHSDDVFKDKILDFICKNFNSVANTESWIELTDNDTKLAAFLMRYCASTLNK